MGRYTGTKGPGIVLLFPIVQRMTRVDLRVNVMDVPSQDLISHDNVSAKVNAVVYFRVVDPQKAIINVEHFYEATSQLAQTTLRSVLGQHDLDEMLAARDKLNHDIRTILDAQTDAWGIKVSNVEIKDVDIDLTMVRAIARQAEAERERRAKVIHAEGEAGAGEIARRRGDAVATAAGAATALPADVGGYGEQRQIFNVVFLLPLDLIRPLLDGTTSKSEPK